MFQLVGCGKLVMPALYLYLLEPLHRCYQAHPADAGPYVSLLISLQLNTSGITVPQTSLQWNGRQKIDAQAMGQYCM